MEGLESRLPRTSSDWRSTVRTRLSPGRAASGSILGVLVWVGALDLGATVLPVFRWIDSGPLSLLAFALTGALASLSRARKPLWILAAFVSGLILLVTCTPFVAHELHGLV